MNTAGHRPCRGSVRNAMCVALCMALYATLPTVQAQTTPTSASVHQYNIPAGPLSTALGEWGAQSDKQVVFAPNLVNGKRSQGISGSYGIEQALTRLLAGTGLAWRRVNSQTYVLKKAPPPSNTQNRNTTQTQASKPAPPASTAVPKINRLDTVTVTGTRIPGGYTASPVITITSQQIQQEGFTNLGQVIRSIPQNFSGGQNPGVTLPANGSVSDENVTGGSAIDLRGLGPDATLTLLNGHRMTYGGFVQAVNINAIPIAAVERLEIVPDGASAIYGSDAVGGVVNVILKRDFNGVTVGARYGGASDGGLITHEYTITAGTTWATGGFIAAGEKTSNDPIYSDQRDYTKSMYRPSTLWQGSELRSGLLSVHQSLGNAIVLHLDALKNERNSHTSIAYSNIYNPHNVKTKTTLLAPSLEVWLSDDWTLTLSGAAGKEQNSVARPTVNRADGTVTAIGIAYRNKSLTYEIGAEGPLFTMPGGNARLAIGAGYRYNDYQNRSGNTIYAKGDQSSRFAYAELDLPLVGPEQDIAGVERFELTGAVRTENGDYGTVTTPKFGVIYSPNTDFSLKASWGKSFKAPTLDQRYSSQNAIYYPAATFGVGYPTDATALWLSGGNRDLHPERARTWSASLAFHPVALTGLKAELTWFDIDYTKRVVAPITTFDVFGNPAYAEFVDYGPSGPAQAKALASASNFYNLVGTPYDASKVVAIIDGRYVNVVRERIKGVDLSGSYQVALGMGRLMIRGSASWLDSTQALTTAQSPYDLAGTLFNPARINSRIGAAWQAGGFTASLFGNYKSGVTNTTDGSKGASFTTFDAAFRYDTGARDDAWSNLTLEFSAQNMLNRAPPLYTPISATYTPYDSTNYSAMGRFLSISLSKHW